MVKIYLIIAIAGITLALIGAEPPRFGQLTRLGNLKLANIKKIFARQEQIPKSTPSSAPYPPAGVTPEIPFDLPSETEAPLSEPDQTYGPPESSPGQTYLPPEPKPDQTYGPPASTPDQTYGVPEAPDISERIQPDKRYSPATTHDQSNIQDPETEELPPSENLASEHLFQPKKDLRVRARVAPLRLRSQAQRSFSPGLHLARTPV